MKRRRISEREEAEAQEKARLHRDELLGDLQAREAARRHALIPEPPEAQEALVPPTEPPGTSTEEPQAPPET